jgi:hypothetical protein
MSFSDRYGKNPNSDVFGYRRALSSRVAALSARKALSRRWLMNNPG